MSRGGKFRGAKQIAGAVHQGDSIVIGVNNIDRHRDTGIAGKIAELNQVVPLRIWRTPFVAQT